MKPIKPILFITLASLISGCAHYGAPVSQRNVQQTREAEDRRIIEERNMRMQGELQDLHMEISRLDQAINRTASGNQMQQQQNLQQMDSRIAGLEQRIHQLEANRQKDKQEIIDRLTKSMADIMRSQSSSYRAAAAPVKKQSSAPSRPTSEYGYEHVVAPGETLSAIAAAYNVSSKTITQANNIKNPNQLRVGQTLFIPE